MQRMQLWLQENPEIAYCSLVFLIGALAISSAIRSAADCIKWELYQLRTDPNKYKSYHSEFHALRKELENINKTLKGKL